MALCRACLLDPWLWWITFARDEIETVELTRAPAEWRDLIDISSGLVIAVALMALYSLTLLFPEKF